MLSMYGTPYHFLGVYVYARVTVERRIERVLFVWSFSMLLCCCGLVWFALLLTRTETSPQIDGNAAVRVEPVEEAAEDGAAAVEVMELDEEDAYTFKKHCKCSVDYCFC